MSIRPRATVEHLAAWLNTVAQCVSMLYPQHQMDSASGTGAQRTYSSGQPSRKPNPGRHVMSVSQVNTGANCGVCDGAHRLVDCRRFRNAPWTERWQIARRMRLCYSCLRTGHMNENCRERRQCSISGCSYEHHHLLHDDSNKNTTNNDRQRGEQQGEQRSQRNQHAPAERESTSAPAAPARRTTPFDQPSNPDRVLLANEYTHAEKPTLYKYLPVTLHGARRTVDTYAFFDDGSTLTLLDEQLSRDLELPGRQDMLDLQWIGHHTSSEPSRHVQLQISGAPRRQYELNDVRTVNSLELPVQSLITAHLDARLKDLPLAEYRNIQPGILIGLDNSHLGMVQRTRTSASDGLIAIKTRLGWLAYGARSSTLAYGAIWSALSDRPAVASRSGSPSRQLCNGAPKAGDH